MWMIALAAVMAGAPEAAPASVPTPVEQRLLAELNRARSAPQAYVRDLTIFRGWHRGRLIHQPGRSVAVVTQEGVAAVDQAIAAVSGQAAAPPLVFSAILARAAADHVAYLADGHLDHDWDDGTGPGDRVERRGGGPYVGEIIAFGSDDPAGVVLQFIVDDGVPDRGHREAVFNAEYRHAGVACGPHRTYRAACVVTLAATPDGR